MRAQLRVFAILVGLPAALADAGAPPRVAELPAPIRDYALALKPYCEQIGKREVVVNAIYSDSFFGPLDANGDGRRDYIVYKCMFGCDGDPYALQGLGPGCMFGSLLLSSAAGYRSVPVPGQLASIDRAPQLRIAVYREHIHAGDCGSAWYCNYVYELRQEWFRLVGACPPQGCRALLSARPGEGDRQAAADSGR